METGGPSTNLMKLDQLIFRLNSPNNTKTTKGNPKKPNLPALHKSWYDSTYKKGF